MANPASIIPALAPLGLGSNFPYPTSFQVSGPGVPGVTYEGPTINGIPMPGQWLLTKCNRVFGWQEQQGAFLSGAYLVPKGDPLMHIEYEIRLWEDGAFALFNTLLGTLLKKPVIAVPGLPASAALGIHDPVLKILNVSAFVTDFIDYPKNPLVSSGGKGAWIGHIGFIEYRGIKPASPVPAQVTPDPGALAPPASANHATAVATVTAGASKLAATAATQLVPPKI
jgi:hypothetical protein